MPAPEYLICLNCETPCYSFEWQSNKITEILCDVCGLEDPDEFASEEDFDALIAATVHR